MLDKILEVLKFLFGLWKALPEEHKEKAKKKAADGFEAIFREFYKASKAEVQK